MLIPAMAMIQFQFHKGTIRTLGTATQSLDIICDFNSIKVRLELARSGALPFVRQFQFHKGTIRTRQSLRC